ncbi:RNA polymerase sigma-70 factor [Pedobacter sp.]|jgi:RNA polymerase sigma-70 factor (family 1)|uniref:RNA polymerase sigma-70 factor n=1 Tax=Pedobacter sp. TaxID=1411316 RepID=UPI002C31ABD0|nr:RNA polymerase sigma-70 factor [Pedobacter sp.]HWW41440.1 RNA polymerase sigma-70 factor [Pedobacter sp.]
MNKSLNLLSDQELLNQCKLNDERAFNTLFDRYFKRLYNFGYGLIQDEDVAKEIAMDVMLRLWQKKGDLALENELLPYLFKSIKNAVYNYWRKAKIITHSLEVFEDSLQNAVPPADSNLEFKELEKQYADFLNEMPEQRRKIFHLSRNENLTYAEIADQLNLSVHTVRNQMSSSVRYFRKHMGDITKLIIIIYLKW